MSTSPTPKTPRSLRPSKFIEGPPLTSTSPNLAQTNEQLYTILQEMDIYESSRNHNHNHNHRKSKPRTSSSSSSNSHSSTSSTSSIPYLPSPTSPAKRSCHDYSTSSASTNKRYSGVRASLDMNNPSTTSSGLEKKSGRSRSTTLSHHNNNGSLMDEGSIRDAQLLGSKIKGRLRAWSRGKDDEIKPQAYPGT